MDGRTKAVTLTQESVVHAPSSTKHCLFLSMNESTTSTLVLVASFTFTVQSNHLSGLEVKFHPAVVTEGQRVTLTCSTSCPLTDNTNYIWYLNSRRLTEPESQNKHLVLDPVTIQHAGNYSCAVKTHQNISSGEKTLTVQSITGTLTAAAAGVVAALLVIMPLAVFFWIR